ncbi:MAG: hypothetical protein J6Y48_02980, partial [Clostridia bacterium]|nr:hypothetical protein [Clostridia bacterium]
QYAAAAYQEVINLGDHTKSDKLTDLCFQKYKSLDDIDIPPYPYGALIPGEGYIFYFGGSPNISYDSAIAFVETYGRVAAVYDDRSWWNVYHNCLEGIIGKPTDEQIKQAMDMADSVNPMHDYLYPKLSTIFEIFRDDLKTTGITGYFTAEQIEQMIEKVK